MLPDLLFEETQRFRQPWIFAIVALAACASLLPTGLVITGVAPADAGGIVSMIVGAVAGLGVCALLLGSHLRTEVRSDGLYIRYIPFHRKEQRIALDAGARVEALTYRPIAEYGGWGIRYGRNGRAYNVYGNRGVLITYTNGRTLLIGSQRAEELAAAILRLVRQV